MTNCLWKGVTAPTELGFGHGISFEKHEALGIPTSFASIDITGPSASLWRSIVWRAASLSPWYPGRNRRRQRATIKTSSSPRGRRCGVNDAGR
jgi:hypothetical protein